MRPETRVDNYNMNKKHKFKLTLSDAFFILFFITYLCLAVVGNYHIWHKDYPVQESVVKTNKNLVR